MATLERRRVTATEARSAREEDGSSQVHSQNEFFTRFPRTGARSKLYSRLCKRFGSSVFNGDSKLAVARSEN